MTLDEAYTFLGLDNRCSFVNVEREYKEQLQKLHSQLSRSLSPQDRKRNMEDTKNLKEALDIIQRHARNNPGGQNTTNPAGPQPHDPSANRSGNTNASSTSWTWPKLVIPASFLIVALMTLMVILAFRKEYSDYSKKAVVEFRVLSVPWCYVELDGISLGPSGQAKPFFAMKGKHTFTFRGNNKRFTRKLRLNQGKVATINVQFAREKVNVVHK